MDEITVVLSLIDHYADRDLSEADTRYKIIDTLLERVLHWPKGPTSCEKYVNNGYADYVLYRKNLRPAIVIEAKREGKYFVLPTNTNDSATCRVIKVNKLLSDPAIRDATLQVRAYCDEIGSDFGGICNGHEWVLFYFNPRNTPWKSLSAFVITSLRFFEESYIQANNLLGYHAVTNNDSLRAQLWSSSEQLGERFYPKSSIPTYDMPVTKNEFSAVFSLLGQRYLSNIPADDHKFMQKCYVSHRQYQLALESGVKQFISDSLTPFFKIEGYKDFWDDSHGGIFGRKVTELIRKENRQGIVILFGGRGSGKSTFISRLFFHLRPNEICHFAFVAVINLIYSAQTKDELIAEIWQSLAGKLDTENILNSERGTILQLFGDRYDVVQKQLLPGLQADSVEYHRIVGDFIANSKLDTKYCCQKLSESIMSLKRGVIVVIDNMDQLPEELQDACFLTAAEITQRLACVTVISMREERYFRARTRGVLDAYHTNGFHLTSPVVKDVLVKRINYVLDRINSSRDYRGEFGISNEGDAEIIKRFLQICGRELRRPNASLADFLSNTTHGDIRQALGFLKGFIASGYTHVREYAADLDWKFQKHQVLRPMMIPDRFFYDERVSQVPNVYQVRGDGNTSHFTCLRILSFLATKHFDRVNDGFVDIRFIIQEFDIKYDLKMDVVHNMDMLLKFSLIEASNRIDHFSDDVDQVRITGFGKYMFEALSRSFTYLELVSLDCGLFDESLANHCVAAAQREVRYFHDNRFDERMKSRIDRVGRFIAYLAEQEAREFTQYALPDTEPMYAKLLEKEFGEERVRIERSVQAKLKRQGG